MEEKKEDKKGKDNTKCASSAEENNIAEEDKKFCIYKCICKNSCNSVILGCSVLSISLSYIQPNKLIEHRNALRPLLNISWGYLFGSGLWVSHINTYILRRYFPKHLFGEIQAKNNRCYFKISSVASAVLLCSTVSLAPRNKILIYGATCSLLANVLNNFYLSKKSEQYMDKKHEIEKKYNIGEVLHNEKEDIQKLNECSENEEYKNIRNKFRLYHYAGALCTCIGFAGLIPYIFV